MYSLNKSRIEGTNLLIRQELSNLWPHSTLPPKITKQSYWVGLQTACWDDLSGAHVWVPVALDNQAIQRLRRKLKPWMRPLIIFQFNGHNGSWDQAPASPSLPWPHSASSISKNSPLYWTLLNSPVWKKSKELKEQWIRWLVLLHNIH